MKFGHTTRLKPELEIIRGFELTEPKKQSDFLPVETGVTILSGQLMYQKWISEDNRFVWGLGCVAGSTPFIAWRDSNGPNSIGSGLLHGLSLGDAYEFQSAYYNSAQDFTVDSFLTFDALTGNLKLATDGSFIVGRVTRPRRSAGDPAAGHRFGERDLLAENLYRGHDSGGVIQWAAAYTGALYVD